MRVAVVVVIAVADNPVGILQLVDAVTVPLIIKFSICIVPAVVVVLALKP